MRTSLERTSLDTPAVANAPGVTRSSMSRLPQYTTNAISNLVVIGLQAFAGIWYTAYLVSSLGVDVYGLVPLAASIALYVNVLTYAMHYSLGRHLTAYVRREEFAEASSSFSTAVLSMAVLLVALLPAVVWFSASAPAVFDVPASAASAATIFFGMVLVAYQIAAVRDLVTASAFAYNRLDAQNAVRATALVLRVAIPVALFALLGPAIEYVGAGYVLGVLISLVFAIVVWRRIAPKLRLSLRLFDIRHLKELLRTGGWLTVNETGYVLNTALDLVIINVILGATIAGEYGTVAQLAVFLTSFAMALSTALTPSLIGRYATEGAASVALVAHRAVRLLGLAMGLLVGLAAGFAPEIMEVWLGPDFRVLGGLLVASVFYRSASLAVSPLFSVELAADKVRIPALVTLASGLLNIGLSILWINVGEHALGVALATATVATLRNIVFTPIYSARVLGLRWHAFLPDMLPSVIGALLVGGAAWALASAVDVASWWSLLIAAAAIGLAYMVIAYRAVLSGDERAVIRGLMGNLGKARA